MVSETFENKLLLLPLNITVYFLRTLSYIALYVLIQQVWDSPSGPVAKTVGS